MNHADIENPQLDRQLGQLREELEHQQTPARVEATLLQAFARHQRKSWFGRVGLWLAPAAGLAASVGMAAWITLAPMTNAPIGTDPPNTVAIDDQSPFLALQSLERIAAEREPRLIETAVPRTMLASLGIPVDPEVAGESMRAQMLVSAEGQPLAMRFLQ